MLKGGWILGYGWASGLGKHWDVQEICRVEVVVVGQESSEAVATWGEAVQMLCFRKMEKVMCSVASGA